MLNTIKKVFSKIEAGIEYICMGTLVFMVAIIFMQVFCRYILKFTPSWSEELSIILMIWVGMIGAALGVKNSIHLAINALVDLFPSRVKRVVYCFDEIAMITFGVTITIYGGELSAATMDSSLPATGLPSGVLYAILPIMGVMVTFYSIIKLVNLILNKSNSLGDKSW